MNSTSFTRCPRCFIPTLAAFLAVVVLAACSKSTPSPVPSSAAPSTPTTASGPTYSINISPTWTVGQKFGYVGDDLSTSSDGQTLIHFEADGEVLALLPSGNPQKLAYIVKNLRVTGADMAPSVLPAVGSKVVVEFAAKGKRIVTFDDKPADPDVADFLQAVLWITIRKHTDQEIYGSSAPVAVGASWPINVATFMDYNEEGDPHFTSAEGSLTLQSVEGDGDNQIGIIAGTYTVKGQNPPSAPGSFLGQFKFTASVPLNHQGVFKETISGNTTVTPPASGLSFLTNNTSTDQETTTQEVTIH